MQWSSCLLWAKCRDARFVGREVGAADEVDAIGDGGEDGVEAFAEQGEEESFLIAGAGGIFDVNINGALIYSKHDTGVFPDEDALVEDIRARNAV